MVAPHLAGQEGDGGASEGKVEEGARWVEEEGVEESLWQIEEEARTPRSQESSGASGVGISGCSADATGKAWNQGEGDNGTM